VINKAFIFKSHSLSIKRNLLEFSTKIKKLGSLNNYQPIRWRRQMRFALALRMLNDKCECFLNAYSGHLCYLWFQFSHAKIRTVWP